MKSPMLYIPAAFLLAACGQESLHRQVAEAQSQSTAIRTMERREVARESRTRYLAPLHDQRIAATMLEFAAGRLSAESEVLN